MKKLADAPVARQRSRTSPPPVVIEENGTPTWNDRWGVVRNERRRELYANDATYREAWLARSRESYRTSQGVELFSCLSRIPAIKSFGLPRIVTINERGSVCVDRFCLTMREIGEAIGGHRASVIYRWQNRGLLPMPVCTAQVWIETTGRGGNYYQTQVVYVLEEAVAILQVIGEHQKELRYYREKDTATTGKVFAAIEKVRETL